VAEGRQIFPTLSVAENLSMGAMIPRAQASRQQNLERVYELFPRLTERRSQAAGTLSGGEQQMLAMARGLATDPAMLLLDELSMGLAPLIVEELYEAVAQVARDGVSILVVEQFAQTVLGVADQAVIMVHGEIVAMGAPSELAGELSSAYLGGAAAETHGNGSGAVSQESLR
jgi:branched-chain amino acid transport system ATP-binding protein